MCVCVFRSSVTLWSFRGWPCVPSLAACQNSNATRKAWATVRVTACACGREGEREWDREKEQENKMKVSYTHPRHDLKKNKKGTESTHKKFLTRRTKGRRNIWAPWQVVSVTRRIRGLLARTKLARGRKGRECPTRSANLQGWLPSPSSCPHPPPLFWLKTWTFYMSTSKLWLKLKMRMFYSLFLQHTASAWTDFQRLPEGKKKKNPIHGGSVRPQRESVATMCCVIFFSLTWGIYYI